MLRSSLITATALLLCGTAAAQQSPQTLKPLKIPAGTRAQSVPGPGNELFFIYIKKVRP